MPPSSASQRRRDRNRRLRIGSILTVALLLVGGLCYAAISAGAPRPTDSSATPGYTPPPVIHKQSTVALGDSITSGNSDPKAGVNGDRSWFTYVGLGDSPIQSTYNDGIGGQPTSVLLTRVHDVIARHPKWCVIVGGTNDVGENVPAATTRRNLQTMINRLRAAKINVALGTIPPRNDLTLRAATLRANAVITALGTANRLPVIDFYSVLVAPNGGYKPGYSDDGVHPTPTAAAVMGALAVKVLTPYYQRAAA